MTPGDVLEPREFTVTRADLMRYAGASGDHNPIHQDEQVATSVGLPGVIAHGMYTLALAARAVADWTDGAEVVDLGCKFTNPVAVPDDVPYAAKRPVGSTARPRGSRVSSWNASSTSLLPSGRSCSRTVLPRDCTRTTGPTAPRSIASTRSCSSLPVHCRARCRVASYPAAVRVAAARRSIGPPTCQPPVPELSTETRSSSPAGTSCLSSQEQSEPSCSRPHPNC